MKRDILKIDEDLCNGCGLCVPNCHEGALQVIDGKVRLISELMCDGLGACIGHCPEGAITIETREAEPYNEVKVMEQMKDKGKNTVIAHLKHMKTQGEFGFLKDGVNYLMEHRAELNFDLDEVMNAVHNHGKVAAAPGQAERHNHGHTHSHSHGHSHGGGGCPGSDAPAGVAGHQGVAFEHAPGLGLVLADGGLVHGIKKTLRILAHVIAGAEQRHGPAAAAGELVAATTTLAAQLTAIEDAPEDLGVRDDVPDRGFPDVAGVVRAILVANGDDLPLAADVPLDAHDLLWRAAEGGDEGDGDVARK